MGDYHGHKTLADGSHVMLTAEEAKELWEASGRAEAERAKKMPSAQDALETICSAKERLRELGWRDAQYCPKDGSEFALVQYGSTGIFPAHYIGEWPDGRIYCCDYFTQPSGAMFKPLSELDAAERKLLAECTERERQAQEREIESFAAMDAQEDPQDG